jgi:hypothetical protein
VVRRIGNPRGLRTAYSGSWVQGVVVCRPAIDRPRHRTPQNTECLSPPSPLLPEKECLSPPSALPPSADRRGHGAGPTLDDRLTPTDQTLIGADLQEHPPRPDEERLQFRDLHTGSPCLPDRDREHSPGRYYTQHPVRPLPQTGTSGPMSAGRVSRQNGDLYALRSRQNRLIPQRGSSCQAREAREVPVPLPPSPSPYLRPALPARSREAH